MNQPIMVGCDLHDQTMLLKVARGREKAQTMSVKNTAAGRAQMISQLKSLADGDPIVFVYEASGQGFGLHDQLIFPEISYEKVANLKGMNVTIVTTARTDDQGRALLKHMGMPFRP